MFRRHVTRLLSAYCQGELETKDSLRVAEHLLDCGACQRQLDEIKHGIHLAGKIACVEAPAAMWSEIESVLSRGPRQPSAPRRIANWWIYVRPYRYVALGALALLILSLGFARYRLRPVNGSWEVMRLDGEPTIGSGRIKDKSRLAVGEWLETDDASRAAIDVANIGRVEVEPGSRVRLLKTSAVEHRLALAQGRLEARIFAPPRLFFVDTPSGVAIDYGCAYTLEVDHAGRSRLHVTFGWVSLVLNGKESMVPAGAFCETRPGIGPGTPYFEDAPGRLQDALSKLDFERGGDDQLAIVLEAARPRDALTLWYLLARVEGPARGRVFDRLSSLAAPPEGVTRDGVLRLNQKMLDRWKQSFGGSEPRVSPQAAGIVG